MRRKPTNYARFYALLNRISGDKEQIKEALIERFTNGRTSHLREMSAVEYDAMCETMNGELNHPGMSEYEYKAEMKRLRSAVLHRMQCLGINTTSWDIVDTFCQSPKIMGKKFAQLSPSELELMISKLEAIARNGGVKSKPSRVVVPMFINPSQLPS